MRAVATVHGSCTTKYKMFAWSPCVLQGARVYCRSPRVLQGALWGATYIARDSMHHATYITTLTRDSMYDS